MEVSTDKMKFNSENSRDNASLQTEYLTYNKKLKNEIEAIPQEYKKFFRNALKKNSFDMEVYIPHLTETNKKVYPNKNYLINKLIRYEKLVNSNKIKKEKKPMGLTNFSKYSYLIENNIKQREYLNNLLKIYKEKGYELENIEYKKKDNIFSRSIFLDHKLGEDTNKDAQNYGLIEENKKNFISDNQLLLRFNDIIHENKSPYFKYRNKINIINNNNNFNVFSNNIENNNEMNKLKIKLKKQKKLKKKNKKDEQNKSLEESLLKNTDINNENENSLIKEIINENVKPSDKDNKNSNTIDIINRDEDVNNSNNNSKIDNTITTYFGNDSLIFNESKNNVENENNDKGKLNLKYNIFNLKNKNDKKDIANKYNTFDNTNQKKKLNINGLYNNLKKNNNKYLLTSSNKVKIFPKDINENSNTIFSKDKNHTNKSINKFRSKQNLKLNLPEINPTATSYKKNLSNNKTIFINTNNKIDNDNIKPMNNKSNPNVKDSQQKIKNLKKIFSKEYNMSNFEKSKKKEVNNLYSTINFKPNLFENFPFDRVENYFLKYKNLKISKLNPNKGSNIHPLLEGLENIVKEKELYKLAKSLNETKKDIYLRSTGTLDNFEKIETLDFEKIKDSDNKIPLLKYDFAENILCNNDEFIENNNKG